MVVRVLGRDMLVSDLQNAKQNWDKITDAIAQIDFKGYMNLEVLHFYEMFPKVTLEFLESWSTSKSPWLKASAIMFQRKMKDKTNKEILGRFISENLVTNDEIVNRAIGSALRDYSKSNHEWVLENVVMNSEKMNKKTKQEAIKWIDSKGLIK